MSMPDALPVRPCPECRVFDDHPRHVVAIEGGGELTLHMDCCAGRGCKVCATQLQRANHMPGIVGHELRTRLVALSPLQIEHADGNPYGDITVSA